jgi:glycosyltransferase involved in cell wall biosynthesis
MKLSIVVPAHNEEENIGSFLSGLSKRFDKAEIIVVCNGCTDHTPDIVKNVKRRNMELLIFPDKIGKGAAVIEGFKHSTGDYIGFVDADGAFDYDDITKIINGLKNSDCVIASKWKGQSFSSVKQPITRRIAGRIWNFFVRTMLDLDIHDTQAGLKFLRREVFESMGKNFVCKGFEFDVELLFKIKEKGFKIKEMYTPIKNVKKTTFKPVHIPKMFLGLIRLRLKI